MATKYKPFLFERRFDEFGEAGGGRARPANSDADAWDEGRAAAEGEDAETEEVDAPPAPSFTEEELEAAKTAAYDEGRRDGLEAGRAEVQQEIDAQIADLLEVVAERVAPLAERQKQAHERASALMAKIAHDVFERLMPAYVQRYGDEEVLGLIADSLANLQDVGRLSVRVAPEAVDALAERLEQTVRLAGFEGKLSVIADPAMARGDAALDWGSGGAERRYKDIWAEVERAVDRAIADLALEETPEETGAEASEQPAEGADAPDAGSADGATEPATDAPRETGATETGATETGPTETGSTETDETSSDDTPSGETPDDRR